MQRVRGGAGAILLVLLTVAGACDEGKERTPQPSGQASAGAAGSGGEGGSTPGRRPPLRPTSKAAAGGKTMAFLHRKIYMGAFDPETGESDPQAWKRMGFDFDGVTTTPELAAADFPGTCQRQSGSRLTSLIDGDDGIDNNFGSEFLRIYGSASTGPDSLEKDLNTNNDSFGIAQYFLVVLEDVADGPDDDEVRIKVMFTVHQDIQPKFDGTDQFLVDALSFVPGTMQTRFAFSRGYMVNHRIISGDFGAPLEGPLYLPLGLSEVLPLALRTLTWTFELDPDHKRVLSSDFAGVVPVSSLAKMFAYTISYQGNLECGEAGEKKVFNLIKPAADTSADLPGFLDPTGQTECDAISFGWRFDWAPVAVPRPEDVVSVPNLPGKCPPPAAP